MATIPWRDGETTNYLLRDSKSGKELGKAVLSVGSDSAGTKLTQKSTSATNTDTAAVIVDARTLKPKSSVRTIEFANDTEEVTTTYTDDGAIIKQGDKQSGLAVPEHAYDNDTSLFLWRTLAFAEGYEARYVTIITNRRSRQTVEIKVVGKEEVSVPAGKFTAWRLEVTAANAKQTAWIADTPARPLVRYDNDRGVLFEMTQ